MDFVERWFHLAPDRGDGSFELVVLLAILAALLTGVFRKRIRAWMQHRSQLLTQSLNSAHPLTVRSDVLQLARGILVGISAKASPQLQRAIDEVRDDLEHFKDKTLLDGLHAAVRGKRKRSNRREESS